MSTDDSNDGKPKRPTVKFEKFHNQPKPEKKNSDKKVEETRVFSKRINLKKGSK